MSYPLQIPGQLAPGFRPTRHFIDVLVALHVFQWVEIGDITSAVVATRNP